MKRKAVIISRGRNYDICCDIHFIEDYMTYVMSDDKHCKEMKLIIASVKEGLKSKKYGDEPYGTKSMKPFLNRENDRIICHVLKRKGNKQCIIMSEIFHNKKTQGVDKKLNTRYQIVSKHEYEIIE